MHSFIDATYDFVSTDNLDVFPFVPFKTFTAQIKPTRKIQRFDSASAWAYTYAPYPRRVLKASYALSLDNRTRVFTDFLRRREFYVIFPAIGKVVEQTSAYIRVAIPYTIALRDDYLAFITSDNRVEIASGYTVQYDETSREVKLYNLNISIPAVIVCPVIKTTMALTLSSETVQTSAMPINIVSITFVEDVTNGG